MKHLILSLATALALATLVQPAMAQPSFGIFFGDEPSDFEKHNLPSPFGGFTRRTHPERVLCLTDYQVRQTIADMGYGNVALNATNNKRVQVRATRDGYVWLLLFNVCSAQIEDSRRLRPAG